MRRKVKKAVDPSIRPEVTGDPYKKNEYPRHIETTMRVASLVQF
jgi:hypothetical protein